MKVTTKLLSLLLVLVLVMTLTPAIARAEEATVETGTVPVEIPFRINPLYEGLITEADLEIPEFPENAPNQLRPNAVTYLTVEQAGAEFRKQMKNHTETFTIYVQSESSNSNVVGNAILAEALKHTGVATEGDYLMWQYGGAEASGYRSYNSTTKMYEYELNFTVPYYTTAAQEKEMTTAVNSLINKLGVRNKTDYEKIDAVYDWLCQNVTYDYENLEDTSYLLKHTAYAALIDRTAVCQGYAVLFYRLMLELGVDNRVIAGLAASGEAHGWNIVELDNLYYNVDSTWDAGQSEYSYFLTNTWDFLGHYRFLEYETMEFHTEYPMAAENYTSGETAVMDPYIYLGMCGDNAYFLLGREGELLIFGEGTTYDGTSEKSDLEPAWEHWPNHITSVYVDTGITSIGAYLFDQETELTTVVMANSVTEIGDFAFAESAALEILELSSNLEILGKSAFYGCKALKSVELPGTIREIGDSVFKGCAALESVSLADGLTFLGSGMFRECSSLREIVLPNSIRSIDSSAFRSCYNLEEIVLPEGLEFLGSYAFSGCGALKEIVIPNSITSMDTETFSFCSALESITLSENLTELGWAMFEGCTSLKSVTVPDGVTSLPDQLFERCTSLAQVELPDQLESIGLRAFWQCTSLAEIWIPDTVTRLEQSCFFGCTNLRKVHISEQITSIPESAFEGCQLEELVWPQNLSTIGEHAFASSNMTELYIPSSVTKIDSFAFSGCTNLEKIHFLGNAPRIGYKAFSSVTATAYYPGLNRSWTADKMLDYGGSISWEPSIQVEEVDSGWSGYTQWFLGDDGILRIGGNGNMKNYGYGGGQPWAQYADQIKAVEVFQGVTAIGSGAFMGLTNLESVILPETGLTKIGEAAFYGCSALKEITIPWGVYTIWRYTFKGCTSLESVTLSQTLLKIDQGAFENCTGLPAITIPTNVNIIGAWSFKGCTNLYEAIMSNCDATEIREGAFKNCSRLTMVHFPYNIRKLGDSAFYGIGAEIFTIPTTVTEVGPWCFARAYSLKDLYFEGNAPTIGEGAFNKITLTVHYPAGNATWTADIMQNYGGTVAWTEN